MGTHVVSFIFNGYDNYDPPYFEGLTTFIFTWVLGVQRHLDGRNGDEFTKHEPVKHSQIWMVQNFAAIQESEKYRWHSPYMLVCMEP